MRVRAVRCISRDADSLIPPFSLSLSLSLSLSVSLTRACTHVFISLPFLSLSISFPFSQAVSVPSLPFFLSPLLAPPRIRIYECTLARVFFCLFPSTRSFLSYSLSFFLSLSLLFSPFASSLVRSRAHGSDVPPVVRRALLPSLRPSSPR